MKFTITDQFLWAIYNFKEELDDVSDFLFRVRNSSDFFPEKRKFFRNLKKKKDRKQFNQFLNYLKKQGYIKSSNLKRKKGVLLTPKGEKKALKIETQILSKNKKRRKDKKWIMVMYDIPERKRRQRHFLRSEMLFLGFKKLQNSVWVCPYDVSKNMDKIIEKLSLSSYIKIFLIEEINI